MKLFGSSGKSRHTQGRMPKGKASTKTAAKPEKKETKKKKKKLSGGKIALIVIASVLLVAALGGVIWYKTAVKPPEVTQEKNDVQEEVQEIVSEKPESATDTARNDSKYTFLVLGCDDGHGNTDTIMAVTFDTEAHSLNVVSIPRDTLVNVPWSVKKVNSLYSASEDTDEMMEYFADILGFKPDFHVVVDIEAFKVIVDAIGGVYYDVPVNMNYDGASVSIHIPAGEQLLTGDEAIGVMRFRSGYANADIGRIGTQQDFLMTAASQILANKDSIELTTLLDIFINYVDTDLTLGNLTWLAKEFLKLDMSNISFHTLPGNYGDYVYHGGSNVSYVTIYVDEWVEMINTYLNPFNEPIEETDLDILTRDAGGYLYATSGVRQGNEYWGS